MELRGQVHASAALPLRERDPGAHWMGSWVARRASLDRMANTKILVIATCRELDSSRPVLSVDILTELLRLLIE
jgi:hypothetical protein